MAQPVLANRVALRMMTLDDTEAFFAYQSDEETTRFLPYPPRDLDTVIEKITTHAQHDTLAAEGDYLMLAIERLSDSQMLGEIYFTVESLRHERGEIGWAMHPDYHGNGYASEAASAMLTIAFTELGLHRVIAQLDSRNTASARLCERLGMTHEAHLRHDEFFKDEWVDPRT